MILETIPAEVHSHVIKIQEESHSNQFLMNFRPEFESVRAALLNRETTPDLETCLQEVLREETRLQSQNSVEESKGFASSSTTDSALLVKNQKVQCYECKECGHVAQNCKKKTFCNYCKKIGHVILECKRRPQGRNNQPSHCSNP